MRAFALACLIGVGGCEQPPQTLPADAPTPETVPAPFLAEKEIRALLGDEPVILRPTPADGAEVFYPDGRYVSESRGAYPEGRYEVSAGQLCVTIMQNPPHCRSVFRGEGGEVRMESTAQSMAIAFEPLGRP